MAGNAAAAVAGADNISQSCLELERVPTQARRSEAEEKLFPNIALIFAATAKDGVARIFLPTYTEVLSCFEPTSLIGRVAAGPVTCGRPLYRLSYSAAAKNAGIN